MMWWFVLEEDFQSQAHLPLSSRYTSAPLLAREAMSSLQPTDADFRLQREVGYTSVTHDRVTALNTNTFDKAILPRRLASQKYNLWRGSRLHICQRVIESVLNGIHACTLAFFCYLVLAMYVTPMYCLRCLRALSWVCIRLLQSNVLWNLLAVLFLQGTRCR